MHRFTRAAATLLLCGFGFGQSVEWRPVGNRVLDAGLAGLASGPVERVWYSPDGATLYLRTEAGRVFATADFESWTEGSGAPPEPETAVVETKPESGAQLRATNLASSPILYAFGTAVYRSSDEGRSWENVSRFRGQSILGEALTDLAVSPRDPEEIAVATAAGVWRSLDGGLSWAGLNDSLPNLPARKIWSVPGPGSVARIALAEGEAIWQPGRRIGWIPAEPALSNAELALRRALGEVLSTEIVSVAIGAEWVYAGGRAGRLYASSDQGRTWRPFTLPDSGDVLALFVTSSEPRVALAALSGPGARVVRTVNGGIFWEDITGNLPAGRVSGLTADLGSGTVYAATASGLAQTVADLTKAGPVGPWQLIPGLPKAPAVDVKLDDGGHQLYVALEGYGVYGAIAPHRFRDPRVVNAADFANRPAAPGTLLSVVGSRVASARAGQIEIPVLAAGDAESQIQVPFGVSGTSLSLALMGAGGDGAITRRDVRMALQATAPAIFVDRDGAPMALDADRGILLDAMTPARAGTRLQVLATGLGAVSPEWPTGLAAPLENAPQVVAPVKAYVDRVPVEVLRATLAPGYIGFYVVEIQVPDIVNVGPAEFHLEVGGQESGRVTLYLTQ
jgi:uncharacterized protein (TIGR03437 family)